MLHACWEQGTHVRSYCADVKETGKRSLTMQLVLDVNMDLA
jgi:hypothetical protein